MADYLTPILCCCLPVVAIVVVSVLGYLFYIYNRLITLRNNIDGAWSNIDVLLKQRSDLIPNLVETVKGYKKYEKQVLEDVTKMRTSMLSAQTLSAKAKASDALSSTLKTLFATTENYPQLQASQNFLDLQKQLSAIENQIAERREFYNESVLMYNTRIHSVPDTLIASSLSMKDKEYFKATSDEEKPVQVNLEDNSEDKQ